MCAKGSTLVTDLIGYLIVYRMFSRCKRGDRLFMFLLGLYHRSEYGIISILYFLLAIAISTSSNSVADRGVESVHKRIEKPV